VGLSPKVIENLLGLSQSNQNENVKEWEHGRALMLITLASPSTIGEVIIAGNLVGIPNIMTESIVKWDILPAANQATIFSRRNYERKY